MDKKEEIIKTTFELFREEGYHLCMSELAEKVEIREKLSMLR